LLAFPNKIVIVNIITGSGTKKSIEKTIFAHVQHFLLWKQNLAKFNKILNLNLRNILQRQPHLYCSTELED
jgi:hypothetical protein